MRLTSLLGALAALVLLAPAGEASGQCTTATPVQFSPPGNPQGYGPTKKFLAGYATSLDLYGSGSKMILRENYGYTTYNLTNPAMPVVDRYCDIEQVYRKAGDGVSTVFNVAAAPDGSRVLVGYLEHIYNGTSGAGTLLMGVAAGSSPGCTFNFGGEMPPTRATGNAVAKVGSRYLGFTTGGTGLYVGDVSTYLTGANAINAVPYEVVVGAPSGIGDSGVVRGSAFVYHGNTQVAIVDFSGVGATGPIASALRTAYLTAADFGFPAGDKIASVAAEMHPNGKLYVMVEAMNAATAAPDGYALATVRSGAVTRVGGIFKDPTYLVGGAASAIATADDVLFFAWREPAGTTPATHKLYTFSANGWGSDMSPSALFTTADYPSFQKAAAMRLLSTSSGHFELYVGGKIGAYAIPVTCQLSTTVPATTDLAAQVSNGSGGFTALAPGATVYLGDTVKLTPSVSPTAAQQPVTDWRMDLDYHAASGVENGGSTFPRLAHPDFEAAKDGVFPSTVTLVGPCDASAGGVPSSGSGCWSSVQGNGASGGPDFPPSVAAGDTKSLTFALEARNAYGSANLKTFDLTWKVPAVRPASTSVLGGAGGASLLTDGSDGHPTATGFSWYFGSDPTAPPNETLTRDASCTGPSCSHVFPAAGTYSYWLTATYANGYRSPDCGVAGACTAVVGKTITVSAVVLQFTAPASVSASTPVATVASTSQTAPGIAACGAGLEYSVVAAGSPAGSSWAPLVLGAFPIGSGTVALPAVAGTYWLRIRYSYTGGAGCTQASWAPSVAGVADPTACPVTVTPVLPTMSLFVNGVLCGLGPGGGSSCQAHPGDAIRAVLYVNGVEDPAPPADVTWTVTPAGSSPSSGGAVNPFTFTAGAAATYTVLMTGYGGASLQQGVDVTGSLPPDATITAPASLCPQTAGAASVVSAGAGATYSWSVTNGVVVGGQGTNTLLFGSGAAGTTQLGVVVTASGGGSASGAANVAVPTCQAATKYYTVEPCRLLDTRVSNGPLGGPALAAGEIRNFPATGVCGIPANAVSLSANATVTQATAAGYLRIFPGDGLTPVSSSLSFTGGRTRANNVTVRLATDGGGDLRIQNGSLAPLHVILDVSGYFAP